MLTMQPRIPAALVVLASLAALPSAGCSIRKLAVTKLGDALAESGSSYATDDDPELIREALPFSLKLIESILDQNPRHAGLLTAASGGFTQYAWAFVQQDADEVEDADLAKGRELRLRARNLYLRAHRYGVRGLEVAHKGFDNMLHADAKAACIKELDFDLTESTAYSDSHTDLAFLEAVGHPVCVNPDRELRRVAREREWPVLEFGRG